MSGAVIHPAEVKALRRGYTTGACAQAAAAAAATAALSGAAALTADAEGSVTVTLPGGESAAFSYRRDPEGVAWVIKDAGDDPDVTHGLAIGARVVDTPGAFAVLAGPGVGMVTLPGLAIEPGAPAVNPAPRDAILAELRRARPAGATATILAPGGEELARRTLNPRLGIVGGISILGTTGRVEPWSVEAMRDSLEPQLDVALARGSRELVFVLGSKGRRLAEETGVDGRDIVETANEVGWMLERAAARGFSSVTVRGHVGKLVKLAAGIFDTHSRVADARLITLAAYAGAGGLPAGELRALLGMNTADQGAAHLLALGRPDVLTEVAQAAAAACTERFDIPVRVVLLNRDGGLLADSAGLAGSAPFAATVPASSGGGGRVQSEPGGEA